MIITKEVDYMEPQISNNPSPKFLIGDWYCLIEDEDQVYRKNYYNESRNNIMIETIAPIQADIIFKALYYVARNQGLEIPDELTEVYKVLAEENPYETQATDTLDVMESLSGFIKTSSGYQEYFLEDESEE